MNSAAQCGGDFVGSLRVPSMVTPCTSPCAPGVQPYNGRVWNTAGERGHDFPGPTAHQIFLAIIDVSVVGIC
jgi:hypothetical protein